MSRIYFTSLRSLCHHLFTGSYWVTPGCFYPIPFNVGFRRTGAGKPESFQTSCPSQVPWQQQSLWSLLCPFDQNPCFFVFDVPFRLGEHWVLGTDWRSDQGAAEAVVAHGGKCTHKADQHGGFLVISASSVTPFPLLIAWQLWFSEASEPVGTWGARFSQWSVFCSDFPLLLL